MSFVPTLGRIVIYALTADDAVKINRRRRHAQRHMDKHRSRKAGVMVHVGNSVAEGQLFPMIITAVWGGEPTSAVNGTVFLDGSDTFWRTSVSVGKSGEPGTFAWPAVRSVASLAVDDKLSTGAPTPAEEAKS